MYNITFRAGMLHETISEWATKKENKLFDRAENSVYTVSIEAGTLDAFIYVLLHEATHVVDAVLKITPHPDDAAAPRSTYCLHERCMAQNEYTCWKVYRSAS